MLLFPSYPKNWQNIIKIVKIRDKFTCKDCGKKYPSNSSWLHVHHIIPLSKGGSNELTNLITLCYNCHSKRHPHMVNRRKKKSKKKKLTFSKEFK